MVGINNGFEYTESFLFDSYLRNIFECRNSSQTSLLPITNYLAGLIEQTQGTTAQLPHCILGSERAYLEYLRTKYHKRPISFSVTNRRDSSSDTLDTITKLIRKTRKYTDYAVLDITDLLEEHPEFSSNALPPSFVRTIAEVGEYYHHQIPDVFSHNTQTDPKEKSSGLLKKALSYSQKHPAQKVSAIDDVYRTMYFEVKKHAIDFEVLKLYDFLYETDEPEIASDKLLEIEPDLTGIAQTEYAKRPFTTTITPSSDKHNQAPDALIIDEWASNIRKALELRESIASDYQQLYSSS